MSSSQTTLFPHAMSLKKLFKENKLEKFYWEMSTLQGKIKASAPIFDGSSVECLIYCAMNAMEVFTDILEIEEDKWQKEWTKCL